MWIQFASTIVKFQSSTINYTKSTNRTFKHLSSSETSLIDDDNLGITTAVNNRINQIIPDGKLYL